MSFYYLASPYSRYPQGIVAAFHEACRQAALLVEAGIPVFSPIAHTHPIAELGGIDPLDHDIWMPADQAFMDAAQGCIVCQMEGWDTSYGVGLEIKEFVRQGKPVYYMEQGKIPVELQPVALKGAL